VRVLMLSWEYPPLIVGGLGRHVDALARELVAAGHEVRVVTRGESPHPVDEQRDGVRVRRAAADPLAIDFTTETLLAWSQAAEHSLLRAALPIVRRWRPDVVHAHDWLVAQSAITLAEVTGAALVTTMHATEAGRHQGWLPRPLNTAIHSVERWLAQRSAAVITCSRAMHDEVSQLFELPAATVHVVPNGIDTAGWTVSAAVRRAARAKVDADPLIVYAGRLVHEKGVQTLLDAMPALRHRFPRARLLVIGTGVYEDALQQHARLRRVARAVDWAGHVPDVELAPMLAAADVAVVPSWYEPFGIVALEAAAARVPVVLTRTGGLTDLIDDGIASGWAEPRDVAGLVDAVHEVLRDPKAAARTVDRAVRRIRRDYTWAAVAAHTAEIYRGAS
jgi:glycogen(starch) synthase